MLLAANLNNAVRKTKAETGYERLECNRMERKVCGKKEEEEAEHPIRQIDLVRIEAFIPL